MSEDDNERKITLGKLVAYPVGGLLILAGLGALVESVVGGLLILTAGGLSLPIIRSRIKEKRGIALSRWATVAIVIVLVAVGAAMGGADDPGGGDNVAQSGATDAGGSGDDGEIDPLIHSMGESFTVGDNPGIEYTVQEAYTADVILQPLVNEEADGLFVILEMEMTNVGDETVDISTRHLQLVDSQDRQFEADSTTTPWVDEDPRIEADGILFEQLQPGVTTQGAVVFEVPEDETELRFKVEPVGILSFADEHYVELELEELES